MAVSMKDLDPAFQGVGNKAGTEIWSIDKSHPTPLPKASHGNLLSGRSYVLLQSRALKSGVFRHDIHYWLGSQTSPDEAAAAAAKAVELDAALGGRAVISREVQGFETDKFLSYFKPCFLPIEGVTSKAEVEDFQIRLFMCKGRHVVHAKEVPFTRSSLNHENVFVLDTKFKIFQFNGSNTDIHQRAKALDVVKYLKETLHKKDCQLAVIEDGKFVADADSGEFWGLFGGFAPLPKKQDYHNDSEITVSEPKFFSVHKGQAQRLEATVLKREILDTRRCYLLDFDTELYAWVGRDTTLEERKATILVAEDFIAQRKNHEGVHLTCSIEGFESRDFKAKFESWPVSTPVSVSEEGRGKVAVLLKHKGFDVKGLLKAAPTAERSLVFNSAGQLQIWRINSNSKEAVPSSEYGKFCNGNCYIVLYSYPGEQREEHLVFSWLGHQSTMETRSSTAQYANALASSMLETAVQVRIFEGKEPSQFLSLFNSLLIIKGDDNATGTKLFEVQQSGPHNWQAIQVPLDALSLNSSGCFFLKLEDTFLTWYGKFSTVQEQEASEALLQFFEPGASSTALKEGSEPEQFWAALGGKKVHPSHREPKGDSKDPHLFSCTLEKGQLKTKEVFNFTQEDLLNDEIMILDCVSDIFVWVGQAVDPKLKPRATDIGEKYIELAAKYEGLSVEAPLYKIMEGGEPSFFKAYFSWDPAPVMPHLNVFQRKVVLLKGQPAQVTTRPRRRASLDGSGRLPPFTSGSVGDTSRTRFGRSPTFRSADPSPEKVRPMSAGGGRSVSTAKASTRTVSALSSMFEFSSPSNGGGEAATPHLKLASVKTKKKEPGTMKDSPSAPASIAPSPRTPRPVASPRSPAIAALASVFESYSDKRHDFAWPGIRPRSEEKTYTREIEDREASPVIKHNGNGQQSAAEILSPPAPSSTAAVVVNEEGGELNQTTYPYERLKVSSPDPVTGIDRSKRETYLSSEDFQETFRMDRDTFYKLPKWKQDKYKIIADLF